MGRTEREHYDPRNTRPARHTDRRARRDPGTGTIHSLAEVEERLLDADEELAELVESHYEIAEKAAEAEADWKQHRDRILVKLADEGTKEAADVREARARRARVDPQDLDSMTGDELYRIYKINEAAEKSVDRHIRALQTRMSALQSVAKGIRGET